MAKLAIILEGGLVQAVLTDDAAAYPLDCTIVDYDTDGAADSELTLVDQGDGTFSTALVRGETVELTPDFFHRLEAAPRKWWRVFAARDGDVVREDVRATSQADAEAQGLRLAAAAFTLDGSLEEIQAELDGFLVEEGDADDA